MTDREAVLKEAAKAVCFWCTNSKPKVLPDYGNQYMHLFQGFPPRQCKASEIHKLINPIKEPEKS